MSPVSFAPAARYRIAHPPARLANQRRRFGYRRLFILLREQGDARLRPDLPPQDIRDWFGDRPPETLAADWRECWQRECVPLLLKKFEGCEKTAHVLKLLEQTVGRERFDAWLLDLQINRELPCKQSEYFVQGRHRLTQASVELT